MQLLNSEPLRFYPIEENKIDFRKVLLEKTEQRLREKLDAVEKILAKARSVLLETAEVQSTISQNGWDHAKEEGDLHSLLEVNAQYLKMRNQLRFALKKIEEGTYGICTDCEQEIDPRRLAIHPSAQFCVPCQREMELDEEGRSELIAWIGSQDFTDLVIKYEEEKHKEALRISKCMF